MPIASLRELLRDDTFAHLATLQSVLDDADPKAKLRAFTTSPYHVVAFLVAYAAADASQRGFIIRGVNAMAGGEKAIAQSEIDLLLDSMDWCGLLDADANDYATTLKTTIVTRGRTAFLAAAAKNCSALSSVLNDDHSVIQVVLPRCAQEEVDGILFITEIEESKQWQKPFKRIDPASDCVEIPCFALSESLMNVIASMREGKTLDQGHFNIEKGCGDGENDLNTELRLKLPRGCWKDHGYDFSVDVRESVNTNGGIYNAFLGVREYCGLDVIRVVIVKVHSEASLSRLGVSLRQEQHFSVRRCRSAPEKKPRGPTVITITQMEAITFLDSGVGVNFSPAAARGKRPEVPAHYIDFKTSKDSSSPAGAQIRCYCQPLDNEHTIAAAIQYVAAMPVSALKAASQKAAQMRDAQPRKSEVSNPLSPEALHAAAIRDYCYTGSTKTDGSPAGTTVTHPICSLQTLCTSAAARAQPVEYPSAKRSRLEEGSSDLKPLAGAGDARTT